MFEAYPPCRQTVTHVLNQKHFLCLEPGPRMMGPGLNIPYTKPSFPTANAMTSGFTHR